MSISYAKLCSYDGDKPISITVYHNEMGKQVFMGSFHSTVNELIPADKQPGGVVFWGLMLCTLASFLHPSGSLLDLCVVLRKTCFFNMRHYNC